MTTSSSDAEKSADFVRQELPRGGLFRDQHWRIAPRPFPLSPELFKQLESLGRVLLQFYKANQLLYRQSAAGKQPEWIARLYDQGKPESLIAAQRDPAFKSEIPRVIRPDLLLTDSGFSITELDSVPGGIGLTAWLGRTYSRLYPERADRIIGGATGMQGGFREIFGNRKRAYVMVSEESSGYRPEMEWLLSQYGDWEASVCDTQFTGWSEGDAVYRFYIQYQAVSKY